MLDVLWKLPLLSPPPKFLISDLSLPMSLMGVLRRGAHRPETPQFPVSSHLCHNYCLSDAAAVTTVMPGVGRELHVPEHGEGGKGGSLLATTAGCERWWGWPKERHLRQFGTISGSLKLLTCGLNYEFQTPPGTFNNVDTLNLSLVVRALIAAKEISSSRFKWEVWLSILLSESKL